MSEHEHDARLRSVPMVWGSLGTVEVVRLSDATAAILDRERAAAARAWDEGAKATADRWDMAPAKDNPYRASSPAVVPDDDSAGGAS